MARKSNGRGSDPSTADASAHEDVEMRDQDDKISGFKKFGVSETRTRNAPSREVRFEACLGQCMGRAANESKQADVAIAVQPGHTGLHSINDPNRASSRLTY